MTENLGSVWKVNDSIHQKVTCCDAHIVLFFFVYVCVCLSKSFQCTTVNILCGAKTIKVTHTGVAYENIRGIDTVQPSKGDAKTRREERCAHSRVLLPPSVSADSSGNFARLKFGHWAKSGRECKHLISFFFFFFLVSNNQPLVKIGEIQIWDYSFTKDTE